MRTTIDKAGRLVIPAPIRERAAEGPRLVRVGKRLVARPTASADTRPDHNAALTNRYRRMQ